MQPQCHARHTAIPTPFSLACAARSTVRGGDHPVVCVRTAYPFARVCKRGDVGVHATPMAVAVVVHVRDSLPARVHVAPSVCDRRVPDVFGASGRARALLPVLYPPRPACSALLVAGGEPVACRVQVAIIGARNGSVRSPLRSSMSLPFSLRLYTAKTVLSSGQFSVAHSSVAAGLGRGFSLQMPIPIVFQQTPPLRAVVIVERVALPHVVPHSITNRQRIRCRTVYRVAVTTCVCLKPNGIACGGC